MDTRKSLERFRDTFKNERFLDILSPYIDAQLENSSQVISPILIQDMENDTLQHFQLLFPYAITFEIADTNRNLLTMYQFAPGNYSSLSYPPDVPVLAKNRPLHQHDFVEVMLVLSGSLKNHIQDKTYVYQTGQCCVMNRNIQHSEEYTSDFQAVFLMLGHDFLQQFLRWDISFLGYGIAPSAPTPLSRMLELTPSFQKTYLDYSPLVSSEEVLAQTSEIFNHLILDTVQQIPGFLFQVGLHLKKLFALLNDDQLFNCSQIQIDLSGQEFLCTKIEQLFLTRHGRVSRSELEEIFGYNSDYMSRLIKQTTGMTLNEYGRQFCLKEAMRQLTETDKSISTIIADLRYTNHTYFYRMFKEMYGVTPGDIRRS